MVKRALVIGSQTGDLSGVEIDASRMSRFLEQQGYRSKLLIRDKAVRQNILTSYEQLISATGAGDAVVVYYSGHGGLAANPYFEEEQHTTPRHLRFIVPFDIAASTENDFRGISSLELSGLLARLTQKTKNVTVIYDCCHAARMSRNLDLVPKALPRTWFVGIAAYIERLKESGLSIDQSMIESNPNAVRLVAAGSTQSAYEYTNSNGEQVGLFTHTLLAMLKDVRNLPVSWNAVVQHVREEVLRIVPEQRPEVEGPSRRLVFSIKQADETGVLAVGQKSGNPVLFGGRLLGIEVGDEYGIMPPAANAHDASTAIAPHWRGRAGQVGHDSKGVGRPGAFSPIHPAGGVFHGLRPSPGTGPR